jgi:hypothetical protein
LKLKFAIVGLAALFGLAAAGSASAMPLAPLSPTSNVENVAMVCGPNGCIRTAPVYRPYAYGYRGGYGAYGVRRYGYGYRGGYGYAGVMDIVVGIAAGRDQATREARRFPLAGLCLMDSQDGGCP